MIDPSTFRWTDRGWKGIGRDGQVLYEMHIGTFTPEGTWKAAARELPELADLGITVIELMPVAELPGEFGWGYDGVNLFAPYHVYGTPDDFRRFVDRAHAAGIGVILDVVILAAVARRVRQAGIPIPHHRETFERCKLDLPEREKHASCYALHRDLLRLRREDPVFRAQGMGFLDGAVLSAEAFALRFFGRDAGDRLLLVNLGADLDLEPVPEPLLAPLTGLRWAVLWSSEDPRYGGIGAPPPEDEGGRWRIPGKSAMVLKPVSTERPDGTDEKAKS